MHSQWACCLLPTHKVMHIYERGREWKTLSKLYCIWIYVYLWDFLSGSSQCLYFQFECMRRGRLFLNGSLLFSFLSYIFLHIKVMRNLIKIKQKICKFFCCITKTHPEKARKFNMSTFSSKKKTVDKAKMKQKQSKVSVFKILRLILLLRFNKQIRRKY